MSAFLCALVSCWYIHESKYGANNIEILKITGGGGGGGGGGARGETARGVMGVGEDGGGGTTQRLRRPIRNLREHLFSAWLQFVFFTHRVLVTLYPKNCCLPCFYPRSVTEL